jgi:predicted CXXCH cytochrome family protein
MEDLKGALFPAFLTALFLTTFFFGPLSGDGGIGKSHAADITLTKHNLSVTGPGSVRASTEKQICIFCHTPHKSAGAPLWNQSMTKASYTVPSPDVWRTLKSAPPSVPDGDSRLCLSCHDGTVALGSVVNIGGVATTRSMQAAGLGTLTAEGKLSPASTAFIGTDLSGHHPVSIEVTAGLVNDKNTQCNDGEVSWKVCTPLPPVRLRPTDNAYKFGPRTKLGVQCTSCHDAHDDPIPGTTKFLREGTASDMSTLCTKCHVLCSQSCQ